MSDLKQADFDRQDLPSSACDAGNGIKLYQPSNGTEGCWFWSKFCDQCVKHPIDPDADNQCQILMRTMLYRVTDSEYPQQWRIVNGRPTCTAFKSRDEYNAQRRKSQTDTNTIDLFEV